MITEIKVYVSTYAKYNSGSLKGQWLDLSNYTDIKELYEAIQAVHTDEQDPEYMFQDIENGFGLITESSINPNIYEIIEEIEDYNEDIDFIEAVLEYMEDIGSNDVSDILESYRGKHDSDRAFTQDFAEQSGYINNKMPWPLNCIDWEQAASDLMYNYCSYNGHYFINI